VRACRLACCQYIYEGVGKGPHFDKTSSVRSLLIYGIMLPSRIIIHRIWFVKFGDPSRRVIDLIAPAASMFQESTEVKISNVSLDESLFVPSLPRNLTNLFCSRF
jgi:hypothetical protein